MTRTLYPVADLSDSARSVVESLVGHPLGKNDVLYIAALGVQPESSEVERNAAWTELESIIADMQGNVAKSALSPEQLDALIDAECEAARYRRDL